MAEKHGLRIEVVADGEAPLLTEDVKTPLFEAVRELLYNVVKHAQTDSATVRLGRISAGAVEVTVSDTGCGFDPSRLTSPGTEGGGFGLFAMRERLSFVGGALEIASRPGGGSRITATVPIRPPVAPNPLPAAAERQADLLEVAPRAGIRILLADDHAVVRAGLAQLLALEPDLTLVGQAGDGQEAIELADRLLPNVILMDASMPGLDGFAATRVIHAAHPAIRIIALSMYDEVEHVRAMREAGAEVFLSKSGPPEVLLAAIRADRTRGRLAAPTGRPDSADPPGERPA
jgi:CheY-like chemotaxis protein/anti-sigma regulatory factor (Ser/Thr protein kinase)